MHIDRYFRCEGFTDLVNTILVYNVRYDIWVVLIGPIYVGYYRDMMPQPKSKICLD